MHLDLRHHERRDPDGDGVDDDLRDDPAHGGSSWHGCRGEHRGDFSELVVHDVLPAMPSAPDVVVIGAGVVGAACALAAARAGLEVLVLDRGPVAGGTTGAGEGNLLVSDKPPGPELDLALLSLRLWTELDEHVRATTGAGFELEPKGGLVVPADPAALPGLGALAADQRAAGVEAVEVSADHLRLHEPHL